MSEREETRKRVKRTIAASLGFDVDAEEIPDSEPLFGEGGATSIASLELIAALEEEFGFEIDDEELRIELFETCDAIVDFVMAKLGAVSQESSPG